MHGYNRIENVINKDVPIIGPSDYDNHKKIKKIAESYNEIYLQDHMGGIEKNGENTIIRIIDDISLQKSKKIILHCIIPYHSFCGHDFSSIYPNLRFIDNFMPQIYKFTSPLLNFNIHPPVNFKNFLISLNGSPHVSRKLLVSALHKMNMFNSFYSTKNFKYSCNKLDGHIQELAGQSQDFYNIFFSYKDNDFNDAIYTDNYIRYDHEKNIEQMSQKISESFVHLVSEIMATADAGLSEKPFYSIVNRGLFVVYGGVHINKFMSAAFGFRTYNKIFNYNFDSIENPLERLIELLTMLKKFSDLTLNDWHDLYLLEIDTIEHNYENFFSKKFIENYYSFCENMKNNS